MTNIISGDGLAKTVDAASSAVEAASAAAAASDKPDQRFADLAERPVDRVVDAVQDVAETGKVPDLVDETKNARSRVGRALLNLSSAFLSLPFPDPQEQERVQDEFKPATSLHLVIAVAADLVEFRNYVEGLTKKIAELASKHQHFTPLPTSCTISDIQGIGAKNISTLTKTPYDFGVKMQKSFGAGDLLGFTVPALAGFVFLKGTCQLLRPGIATAQQFLSKTSDRAMQRFLDLPLRNYRF